VSKTFLVKPLSINPSLHPFRAARRSFGLAIRLNPISEEEVGFFAS
jgi:hypothetical protein